MPVKKFVTKQNTLLITVDNKRYYEFRDLTARDILWMDFLGEADLAEDNFQESLSFLMEIVDRLLISANSSIENEEWRNFVEISRLLQEYVLANRLDWKSFLQLVFAAGHKTFIPYEMMMDLSLTIIHDFHQTIIEFYEQQQRMMDEAKGIQR